MIEITSKPLYTPLDQQPSYRVNSGNLYQNSSNINKGFFNNTLYAPTTYLPINKVHTVRFKAQLIKVEDVLKNFAEISKITRPSGYNKDISNYLVHRLKQIGFNVFQVPQGEAGAYNIFAHNALVDPIKKNALILQGHMDIVSIAKDGNHTKPIDLIIEGDYLKAKNERTLGADNGLGLAYILSIAEKFKSLPLQVIFTIDEEIGLLGAKAISPNKFLGKKLINLDTGGLGKIIIGCPGVHIFDFIEKIPTKTLSQINPVNDFNKILIDIHSATGGHSGLDIHKNRLNPIKQLLEVLYSFNNSIYIQSIQGGHVHNAIPAYVKAQIITDSHQAEFVHHGLKEKLDHIKELYQKTDPHLQIDIKQETTTSKETVLTEEFQTAFLELFGKKFKNGVLSYQDNTPLPKTSQNLGKIDLQEGFLKLAFNMRSIDHQDNAIHLEETIRLLSHLFQKDMKPNIILPIWEANPHNTLATMAANSYRSNGIIPKVEIASGTVEPALFANTIPEQISVRADIYDQHAITERIHLPSLEPFNKFLETLLLKLSVLSF